LKPKYLIPVVIFAITGIILSSGYFNPASTHTAGAPAGYCGSVVNSSTCSYCHSGGPNTVQAGWITSNVPVSGYVPGTTYTITATATYSGRSKFGFEISPQNTAGTYLGTCVITDATNTQLIVGTGSRRYMTHKTAGTTGTANSHTWTFNWTAPAAGSGGVTFYGAFLCTNSNNSSSGDLTYKSSLALNEDITTTDDQNIPSVMDHISVYPNPATDYINLHYRLEKKERVEIDLLDLTGRQVASTVNENDAPGVYEKRIAFPFNINSGIYFLQISTESGISTERVLIQR